MIFFFPKLYGTRKFQSKYNQIDWSKWTCIQGRREWYTSYYNKRNPWNSYEGAQSAEKI